MIINSQGGIVSGSSGGGPSNPIHAGQSLEMQNLPGSSGEMNKLGRKDSPNIDMSIVNQMPQH